jgi:hypothetical protein
MSASQFFLEGQAMPPPNNNSPDNNSPDPSTDVSTRPLDSSTGDSSTTEPAAARATSFGTFKPVGHVMLGLPNRQALSALKAELAAPGGAGCPADELTPLESIEEMQALIDNASPLAGFGYEMTLMRRYLSLAQQGYSWLVVKTNSDDEARLVADRAKAHGATLAVRYGSLMVEDLI